MVRVSTPPTLARAGVFFGFSFFMSIPHSLTALSSHVRRATIQLCPRYSFQRSFCFRRLLMKLIVAIIQPARLEAVKAALSRVEVFRLTLMDVQGFGRQKGHTETYRGHDLSVNLLRKVRLEIAVNDDFVEPTIEAIVEGGRSGEKGEIGDGKVFVLPMDDCVRIRTGERGNEAI